MLFSWFCGVSVFDILLICTAAYYYFKNRRLEKKYNESLEDLSVNKEGQIIEKGVEEDNCAW